MKNYIVYNVQTGIIVKTGICSDSNFARQAEKGQKVIEGEASDVRQKVVDNVVVDKTPEEIEADKPPAIPFEHKPANITNEQWQDVLNRLDALENSLDK